MRQAWKPALLTQLNTFQQSHATQQECGLHVDHTFDGYIKGTRSDGLCTLFMMMFIRVCTSLRGLLSTPIRLSGIEQTRCACPKSVTRIPNPPLLPTHSSKACLRSFTSELLGPFRGARRRRVLSRIFRLLEGRPANTGSISARPRPARACSALRFE
jgi:hypothetical protein